MQRLDKIKADRNQERAMDIEDSRGNDCPRSTTKITCLMAARNNGYWLLKRGRRMRSHEALGEGELYRMAGNAMNLNVIAAVICGLYPELKTKEAQLIPEQSPKKNIKRNDKFNAKFALSKRAPQPEESSSPKANSRPENPSISSALKT